MDTKFDIDKLTPDEAERLGSQIGETIRQITDKAVEDANRLLSVYGLEAKMQIIIGKIGELTKPEKPTKTRKPRKKKEANL